LSVPGPENDQIVCCVQPDHARCLLNREQVLQNQDEEAGVMIENDNRNDEKSDEENEIPLYIQAFMQYNKVENESH
jgi:hypothetical protein